VKKSNLSRREFIRKSPGIVSAGLYSDSFVIEEKTERNQSLGSNQRIGTLDSFEFHHPGTEYRGIPLWFFNDRLDKEDLIAQLKAMRYAGWGRVMPRRYTGGINPAYGKIWNDAIRTVIEVCKGLDMKVYLPEIDKNGWYTAAPTPLPGMKDEFRNKSLIQRGKNDKPGKNEKLITQIGEYSYYQFTSFPKEGWENSFCYLDLLDPDVVNSYSKVLFEFFYREFGSDFGKTVEGIWIAEPHIMMGQPTSADCLPWTPKLPQVFEKDWGYPLLDKLPLLFNDEGEYQKVRYHYWRTLSNLFTLSYMKTTGEWCRKYNLILTGHLMGEDSFISQLQYSVNVMPHYEYMDMPGIDHLTMNLNWPSGDPFILTPKQVSSVANQLRKKEVISEMYGCSDMGLSFEDRKRMYQWFSIMGINYRCYHGSFMSMRGARKRIYPPSFNYQQPYWSENRIIGDFGGRLSYALRQGKFKADILIIHPIESYFLKGKIARKLSKVIGENDQHLINLSHNLLKIQRSFDYGDETILSKHASVIKNQIQVGQMKYKVIILPSIDTVRKSTFKLLKEFLNSGGTIISTGNLPTMIDGEVNKEIEAINIKAVRIANDPGVLKQYFEQHLPGSIQITTPGVKSGEFIWVHQRILDNGQIYFLSNINSEEIIEAEIKIRGKGRLESWNLETGEIETVPQAKEGEFIKTNLSFAPNASYLLVLNENATLETVKPKETKVLWKKPVDDFLLKREDPNSLTLDFCRYKKGSESWSESLPVMGIQEKLNAEKYYGPVSLQFEFEADEKPGHCEVVIEEANKYNISVNGAGVKYDGLPYYRDRSFLPVRITHLVKKGSNTIEISREFQSAEEKVLGIEELDRFYGTELEQIYLIGDFAVKGKKIGQDQFETARTIFDPRFTLSKENNKTKGDLLNDGYCFFNGTINLISDIVIPQIKEDEKYYLVIENLETVYSKVRINNLEAGNISWKPYKSDITDLVWKGENKLEIALTNSLRNLLGEIHFIPIEEEKNSSQWSLKVTPRLADGPDWYEKRKTQKLKTWSDNYYFRPFGIFGEVSIIAEKQIKL
jgi:hypothetical protein